MAALGTGSSNAENRLLDVWLTALGDRLIAAEAQLSIPNVPDTAHVAAGSLCGVATESAQPQAATDLAVRMTALKSQSAALDRLWDTLLQQHQMVQDEVMATQQVAGQAQQQFADLQRLIANEKDQLICVADQLAHARPSSRLLSPERMMQIKLSSNSSRPIQRLSQRAQRGTRSMRTAN